MNTASEILSLFLGASYQVCQCLWLHLERVVMRLYKRTLYIVILTIISISTVSCQADNIVDNKMLNDVAESIFSYEISKRPIDKSKESYFLYIKQSEDPDEALLNNLRSANFPVKPVSQSKIINGRVEDKNTGFRGLLLGVFEVECKSSIECEAKGRIYLDFENDEGWVYQIVKRNGHWIVKGKRLFSIV